MWPIFLFRDQYLEYEREQIRCGTLVFSAEELAPILARWAGACVIGHNFLAATLGFPSGEKFEVAPDFLKPCGPPSHDGYRAMIRHVADQWGGYATLGIAPDTTATSSREERLWLRAYAEVYAVRIDDEAECYGPLALTCADLAKLPTMRAQIRAMHSDAPEAPQDEGRQLARVYASRLGFS